MLGSGQTFWQDSIYILPQHFSFVDIESIHPVIKNLPVLCSLMFMFLTYSILTYYYILVQLRIPNLYLNYIHYHMYYFFASWSFHAGFLNTLYNKIFINIFEISYTGINKYLDKGFFEYFGPFGIYKFMRFLNKNLHFSQYSFISFTISFMFIGIILMIWYWLFIFSLAFLILIKHFGIFCILVLFFILSAI